MQGTTVFCRTRLKAKLASFTLIELLTVMAIIAILAALVLMAGMGVMNKAARSRASAEIQAMSTASKDIRRIMAFILQPQTSC